MVFQRSPPMKAQHPTMMIRKCSLPMNNYSLPPSVLSSSTTTATTLDMHSFISVAVFLTSCCIVRSAGLMFCLFFNIYWTVNGQSKKHQRFAELFRTVPVGGSWNFWYQGTGPSSQLDVNTDSEWRWFETAYHTSHSKYHDKHSTQFITRTVQYVTVQEQTEFLIYNTFSHL